MEINMLPPLPKQRQDEEAKFGLEFNNYFAKKQPFNFPVWFELKDSYGKDTLLFSAVSDKQVNFGMKVKYEGTLVRHTVATTHGVAGIPDYQWVYKQPVYVVIRYPKSWCFIDIETFVNEKARSVRKSLTEQRAKDLSIKVINT